jgi:hypothetical protein
MVQLTLYRRLIEFGPEAELMIEDLRRGSREGGSRVFDPSL